MEERIEGYLKALDEADAEEAAAPGAQPLQQELAKLREAKERCQARRRSSQREGKRVFEYDAPNACAGCRLTGRCTESGYRTVTRWEHEERLERMEGLLEREPAVLLRAARAGGGYFVEAGRERKAAVCSAVSFITRRLLTNGVCRPRKSFWTQPNPSSKLRHG